MSIASVSSTSASIYTAPAATGITPTRAAGLANTAVSLSSAAGVIALLGGTAATPDSAQQIYSALTVTAPSSPASAASAGGTANSGTVADTSSTGAGTTSSSTDINASWSNILKSNPQLAPLAVQLSVQQSLVDTFA